MLERLDRLDPESLQTQFLHLVQERGLLETIFQSIQEGIIVIDGEGSLTYANRASERLLGFSVDKERGKHISRMFQEIDWDRILELDAGEWSKLITREIEITYPEHKFVSFYVVPLDVSRSNEHGAVVILRDITHERNKEASLLESERLNAVKLLAAGVAHEIGNPLNALNIHLQLLERELNAACGEGSGREGENESLLELVDVARNEVSRLDLIITQFLRAIRPAEPKLEARHVEDILKETLTLLKQEIQNRKIEVEVDFGKSLPIVKVDRNQIKQAFFNLIRNAFQAMPDGGALKISLTSTDQYFSISFRDTGTGIKPEDFGHIFEPSYTTKPDGSGLGLMIVQRIVQDHGGQIEVVSKPQAGTSITMQLPLAEKRIRLLKSGGKQIHPDSG